MRALVTRGNQAGVPILMSIGGWTGSQTFSTIAADAGLRKKFINNAMVFVRNNTLPLYETTPDGWNMDGIDIDWYVVRSFVPSFFLGKQAWYLQFVLTHDSRFGSPHEQGVPWTRRCHLQRLHS